MNQLQTFQFQFQFQMGWAVYAAQRLRPQHGSISHPQKIPSKYWVLKIANIANITRPVKLSAGGLVFQIYF